MPPEMLRWALRLALFLLLLSLLSVGITRPGQAERYVSWLAAGVAAVFTGLVAGMTRMASRLPGREGGDGASRSLARRGRRSRSNGQG